ncbi:hypothetical protein ACFL7D_09580 [candidate division KSB1 bacterium]
MRDKSICWGHPVSYPKGSSSVKLALLEFCLVPKKEDASIQEIYEAFEPWLKLFEQYVKLLTTQHTRNKVSGGDGSGRLDLLYDIDKNLEHIYRSTPTTITIEIGREDESLHIEQLRETVNLASGGYQPKLQYRILLEAYRARKDKDYRKAIIESATALEICLTERILREFNTQGITFGEKLLKKFRMLGGRFELVKMLGISHPDKDYKTIIIEPRNNVVHGAIFPNKDMANNVITEVKELLQLFSPQLHENI